MQTVCSSSLVSAIVDEYVTFVDIMSVRIPLFDDSDGAWKPLKPLKSKSSSALVNDVAHDRRRLSFSGCCVYLAFVVAFSLYASIRIDTAASALSLVILAAEALAALRVAVYGLYIVHQTRQNPAGDVLGAGSNCTLRVMVPCYDEALAIVQETVIAAAATALPPGCCKFLYLYVVEWCVFSDTQ